MCQNTRHLQIQQLAVKGTTVHIIFCNVFTLVILYFHICSYEIKFGVIFELVY